MSHHEPRRQLLAQPSLQAMAACIGLLLLGWPVIQIAGERGHWILFYYVFTAWAALVLLLVFVGRAIHDAAENRESTSGPDPQ